MMKNAGNHLAALYIGKKVKIAQLNKSKSNKKIKKVDKKEQLQKMLNVIVSLTFSKIEMPETKFLMIKKMKMLKKSKVNVIWIWILPK